MLLVLFGPPAVGKMTIGRAIARRGRFHLFHNHMTIEPLIETFGHGTAPFNILNDEFRRRVMEEAARHQVDLVFSVVWALDHEGDRRAMESYAQIFGGDVAFVELRADQATRLQRNHTEERLLHKASKRDLDWSDNNVRELDAQWTLTTEHGAACAAELLDAFPFLVVDTTALTAAESADRIVEWVDTLSR